MLQEERRRRNVFENLIGKRKKRQIDRYEGYERQKTSPKIGAGGTNQMNGKTGSTEEYRALFPKV